MQKHAHDLYLPETIMKFSVTFILILYKCAVSFAALTNRWEIPEGRIVGGHEAKPHSYPFIVSLQMRFFWVRMHICGGSLLNEYWVLTAGHCVKESWLIRWLPMDAIAGAHNVDNFGPKAQVNAVERRIPHPSYKGGIGPNDIALLKVKTPFTFTSEVQPVNLPVAYKMSSESLTLAGWGVLRTTVFIPDLPSKLQEVQVTYIPYEECYEAVEFIKDIDEDNPLDKNSNICTGPTSGGIAACNGDSGGPLVQYTTQNLEEISNDAVEDTDFEENEIDASNPTDANLSTEDEVNVPSANDQIGLNRKNSKVNDRIPVILGVVSWGASPCGQKGAPTVYTKVAPFIDFINQYITT